MEIYDVVSLFNYLCYMYVCVLLSKKREYLVMGVDSHPLTLLKDCQKDSELFGSLISDKKLILEI